MAGQRDVWDEIQRAYLELRQFQKHAVESINRAAWLEKRDHALAMKSRDAINRSRQRLQGRPPTAPRLQQQLAQADRHIREGRERIEKQQAFITKLAADGHHQACVEAQDLLRTLMETQRLAEEDRERIVREMEATARDLTPLRR